MLPDPQEQPEFYQDVMMKRLFAFVIDTVLIVALTLLLVPLTAFTALFYLGALGWVVALIYRALALARHSATPGMRLMGIELRRADGSRADPATAFAHAFLLMAGLSLLFPQLVSAVTMLTGARGQALHDLALGCVVINRPAGG